MSTAKKTATKKTAPVKKVAKTKSTEQEDDGITEDAEPITVNSGVAMPTISRAGGAGRASKYPFADLEIEEGADYGDSFFVAGKTTKSFGATVGNAKKKVYPEEPKQRNFAVRAVVEEVNGVEVSGVRVWRVPLRQAVEDADGIE